jgi:hypothetical protein
MCRPATCRTCSKTTWAGCGQHVDQVMRNVPAPRRCDCTANQRSTGGFFGKLFGG